MKWYWDVSVYIILFGLWYGLIRDNETQHYIPHIPEHFVTPEPLTYSFPFYNKSGWTNYEGYKLTTYEWFPPSTVEKKKAIVFIIPGYGVSADLYSAESKLMTESGLTVFGIDPVGQGRSEGLRMYVSNFNRSCQDYGEWIEYIRKKYPEYRTFLWGGSMGGASALTIVLNKYATVDGLILTAPAVKISDDLYPWLRKVGSQVSEFIPTWPVAPPLHLKRMCLDENVDIALQSHPLVYHGRIRAGTGSQMLSACEYLSKNLEKVTLPFLVMHGADDDIVKMEESSKLLYERASSVDKTLKVWPNEWHNFLMSPNYKTYVKEAISWIDARIKH